MTPGVLCLGCVSSAGRGDTLAGPGTLEMKAGHSGHTPMAPIFMVSQLLSLESLETLSPHLSYRGHQVLLSLPFAPSHPPSLSAVCGANSSASLTSSSPDPHCCSNVQHSHRGSKAQPGHQGPQGSSIYKPSLALHTSTFYTYTFAQVSSLA